ncbi:MAG: methylaspartate mutase subunit E [Rhodospirillales bacterium]
MVALPQRDADDIPFSAARIDDDVFNIMRAKNLARWPTGAEVDIEEAAAFHKSLPKHKQLGWVMRQADAEGRCLTQPRGGFGTLELQKELMICLDQQGQADIVPTTTDSYTRNEQWENAARGIEESKKAGRSMLNGYPMVNYGPKVTRQLIEAIDKPAIVLSGTSMPKLTCEIGFAAGYSGYLGSGLAYTSSYTKSLSIEQGIRNYQYLDRLAAMYSDHGVELHRRQPGFLTGTNIPPCIAILTSIIDALLAAGQGVKNYGLELGQTMHLVQDAAAIKMARVLTQEYLQQQGYHDVFTPVTSLHWMGAWPHDEAQCEALVSYGGTLAAIGGAVSVTTKSSHEAFGIPTPEANAAGLRSTHMAVYLARQIRLNALPEFETECDMIAKEVRPIMDKILEMGDGDVAIGTIHACEAGVMDIPWSPSNYMKSRVMPARDIDGYLRMFDCGEMPMDPDVMEFHHERVRKRAEHENISHDHELAVASVYELSENLEKLIPFPWAEK